MEYISPDKVKDYEVKIKGRIVQTKSPCAIELEKVLGKLSIGEAVRMESSEWKLKSRPSNAVTNYVRSIKSTKTFRTNTLLDNSGWLITRLR